jgi:hypothetical protein
MRHEEWLMHALACCHTLPNGFDLGRGLPDDCAAMFGTIPVRRIGEVAFGKKL